MNENKNGILFGTNGMLFKPRSSWHIANTRYGFNQSVAAGIYVLYSQYCKK
eukprot:COSAG05_NODE_394_length_10383_cov_2.581389_4_plen_51_part_00